MKQFQIKTPSDLGKLIDLKTANLKVMTQKMIDAELGLVELNVSLGCVKKNHVKDAHKDTQKFKEEIWKKSNSLEEYEKSINFI